MILDIEVADAARVAEQLLSYGENGSEPSNESRLLANHLKRMVEGANAILGKGEYVGSYIRIQVNVCGERARLDTIAPGVGLKAQRHA